LTGEADARVELYWLPLGAGGHFVRFNGRVYERLTAWVQHRRPQAIYHSALQVFAGGARYVVEMTPAGRPGAGRGVVGTGPVGARAAGRLRAFRYELRRWRDGVIPDLDEAVGGPRVLSVREADAWRVLELVPQVPMLVWGRDELHLGEMWNSNSQIAWVLERAGLQPAALRPPRGGRAPGWNAGVLAARPGPPGLRGAGRSPLPAAAAGPQG